MADPGFEEKVLERIDPLYFLDYALFTGKMRKYVSMTLEEAFKNIPTPHHRKYHSIIVFKEEFSAYEDAGAFLKAFLDFRHKKIKLPIISLLSFKPKDVVFSELINEYQISSAEQLYEQLGLHEWVHPKWADWFPHFDLKQTLSLSCLFFFSDCVKNQGKEGVVAYNKLKHGPIVVPSGNIYIPILSDAPAVMFHTDTKNQSESEYPFTLYPLTNNDATIEERYRMIDFIQCNLRLFAALYVIWRYPQTLTSRGIAGPKELFEIPEFSDIRHLMGEVTAKK